MANFEDTIQELETLSTQLAARVHRLDEATIAFDEARKSRRGDIVGLNAALSDAVQSYNQMYQRCHEYMGIAQKQLIADARAARKRGVLFPEQPAERMSPRSANEYSDNDLIQALQDIRTAIQALLEASTQFDALQKEIASAIAKAIAQLDHLERLGASVTDEYARLKPLQQRHAEPREPREPVLAEVMAFVRECQAHADELLDAQITANLQQLSESLMRLKLLGVESRDEQTVLEGLTSRHNLGEISDQLFADIRSLIKDCHKRVESRKKDLEREIEEWIEQAKAIRSNIHPAMREAVELDQLFQRYESLTDELLLDYASAIQAGTIEARAAGAHALAEYRSKAKDPDFSLTDLTQLEVIGTAMGLVATQPEEYAGPLWKTGEDILLHLMFGNLDTLDFYNRFGYNAVAIALQSAIEKDEIALALSVLNSGFLPPIGASESERIRALLNEPSILALLEKAAAIDALILKPAKFKELNPAHHSALLLLLEHADEAPLTTRVQLQWSALLHSASPAGSEMHLRVSRRFLLTLAQSGRYLALYYSFMSLGTLYPTLWQEPVFRPMLRHVIEHAVVLDSDGRRFLIELLAEPGNLRMAGEDFGCRFLLGSLSHYLTAHWGQTALLTEAWACWDWLAETYPVLADILHRNLGGEQFGDGIVIDLKKFREEFDETNRLIEGRLETPGFRGVNLAQMIYRWYVKEDLLDWLDQIKNKQVTLEKLDQLASKVSNLQQIEDLVDNCPYQRESTISGKKNYALQGRLKDEVNSRLHDLLGLYQKAIKMRRQLLSEAERPSVPQAELAAELRAVRARSDTALWAVQHLLTPEIPFIASLKVWHKGT